MRASPKTTSTCAARVLSIGKVRVAEVEDIGIDFIEPEIISLFAIGRHRSGAEPDDADAQVAQAAD